MARRGLHLVSYIHLEKQICFQYTFLLLLQQYCFEVALLLPEVETFFFLSFFEGPEPKGTFKTFKVTVMTRF